MNIFFHSVLFTHFLKSKNVFSRGFFLKILTLCMVCIQEWYFVITWVISLYQKGDISMFNPLSHLIFWNDSIFLLQKSSFLSLLMLVKVALRWCQRCVFLCFLKPMPNKVNRDHTILEFLEVEYRWQHQRQMWCCLFE